MGQEGQAPHTRRPRVTIKDVARAAGVSPATVSQTYSGRRSVSATTRARVLAAAEALDYSADPHARSMRTGRSEMIGLVLRPRFAAAGAPATSETFNRLAGSMATECLRRGIGLVHVPDPTQPSHAAVPMDGCIVAHPYANDPTIDFLSARGVPIVCADPDPERPGFPWTVGVDYSAGMQQVFASLKAIAGEHVWLLPGAEDNAWNREARRTFAQWRGDAKVRAKVLPLSEGLSAQESEERVAGLIADHGPPDALVFSVSTMSTSVLRALATAGLQVPRDVRVAALTDSTFSRTAYPALTALDLNHEGLASAAVNLLMRRLAGGEPPSTPVLIPPALQLRESTGT